MWKWDSILLIFDENNVKLKIVLFIEISEFPTNKKMKRVKDMSYIEELDLPSAKERFMNNEALYKKFLVRYPDSTLMDELEQHLAAKDIEQAFCDAHTLKGMVGNLSMYRLMNAASKVTENLRAGQLPEDEELEELRSAHKAAVEAVNEVVQQNITLF